MPKESPELLQSELAKVEAAIAKQRLLGDELAEGTRETTQNALHTEVVRWQDRRADGRGIHPPLPPRAVWRRTCP